MTPPENAPRLFQMPQRVALVHDWLTGMRGGEKCLEVLCELFPRAEVYTLLHNRGSVSPTIESHPIRTSFVQHLPGAARGYRRYLPLFPWAIENLRPTAAELVVSSSTCVAKGVRPGPGALHVCYCNTPMRYVWDQFDAYFGPGRAGVATRFVARLVRRPLQRWDVRSSSRVHLFIANSEHVRQRIRRFYGRESQVLHPPVDCGRFPPTASPPEDYFLVASALSGYKRVDLAVEAARRAGVRLLVVGQGPDLPQLQRLARGSQVEFLPWQAEGDLARLFARCQALLFPGVEDFGITPVEVMAAGRPVIARAAGGALETVVPGETGILVHEDDPEAWARVLRDFRSNAFEAARMRQHAMRFDRSRFVSGLHSILQEAWENREALRVEKP